MTNHHPSHRLADLAGIGVVQTRQGKPTIGKALVVGEGHAEVPHPDEDNVERNVEPERGADLGNQRPDVISHTPAALTIQIPEVLPNLRRFDVECRRDLPR